MEVEDLAEAPLQAAAPSTQPLRISSNEFTRILQTNFPSLYAALIELALHRPRFWYRPFHQLDQAMAGRKSKRWLLHRRNSYRGNMGPHEPILVVSYSVHA